MTILNSDINDVPTIFEMYRVASAYMKSKNQVSWPDFPRELVETEIYEKRQWKIIIDDCLHLGNDTKRRIDLG